MTNGELLTFFSPIEMESSGADASSPRVVLLSEIGQHNPPNLALAERLTPVDADASGLVRLMHEYAAENGCSLAVALSEVTKRSPRLWERHSEAVMKEAPGERIVIPTD
jgi:hypothetical protein